ncbi:hypothetical protein DFW101_0231 [Solidesulfovibrio carbinoliphilus subsp. oakridgensis]|uniref:Zinc-ribbon 15 domain-containing protein n=1 Tax=Solidesulfovibrio carbinoliphilus subsp. oakridgensis TaxID=694327 RepID=G7QCU2_9BACT|nr:hypothetical protein [Solidesulfovibrio carbinoliphilus]EHJ46248.1 hypothetical protein DFW101_0231 [Solidesulfovibrio carbinoliphilus subsp. oakridgensis]
MQRRYCPCGTSILVDFRPAGPTWLAVFFKPRLLFRSRVSRCPRCGAPLDIDSLS